MGSGQGYPPEWPKVSLATKLEAGFRCVRCGHPNGIWCPTGTDVGKVADAFVARHGITSAKPIRRYHVEGGVFLRHHLVPCDTVCTHDPAVTSDRILTVHHLDGVKTNLAWYNLAALCQRCHLTVQGRVKMWQTWSFGHSPWFYPYVAGYYAKTVLGLKPTRQEVEADLFKFLTAGQPHLADHYAARLG